MKKGTVTFKKRLMVTTGTVNLILCDGATLEAKKGITVNKTTALKIWQQSGKSGKLVATTTGDHVASISVNEGASLVVNGGIIEATTKTDDAAGIGGDKGKNAGKITINAGKVTAVSDMNAAGIGGGKGGSGGTITINSGTVTATAKDEDGAGIGGGEKGTGGTITINGGTVTAKGTDNGAGIGGNGASGTIKIAGGTVTATGGTHGAGIGGGNKCKGTSITISGGTVSAKGGDYAAGIGGGGDAGADTIKISGGIVTARGGKESAGIGSANKGNVKTIEITGGDVIAIGANNAAGVGGGDGDSSDGGQYGTITISGEKTRVQAVGGNQAAGIGTGNDTKVNKGTINIKGGAEVEAWGSVEDIVLCSEKDRTLWAKVPHDGSYLEDVEHSLEEYVGHYGAGIGGGDQTSGGTINISGAKTRVYAYGGEEAAAIGCGDKANATDAAAMAINITGGYVEARGGGEYWSGQVHGHGGAGIGGGRGCGGDASGTITISGSDTKVDAEAGEYGAAIGGGDEGGFKKITIKDGATVNAKGGKHGAGIGTGDVSDNGGKTDWTTGTITIEGENTKVTATGGDDGAAGIGGGDDGNGCTIVIKNVGMAEGSTGFVKADGTGRASGIGGGVGKAFGKITVDNAVVTAMGQYGAGIGTGGGKLGKDNPGHVEGGAIDIKNADVLSISAFGGAGIGGGIFGRANTINISGGNVMANGGAMIGMGQYPAFAILMLQDMMAFGTLADGLSNVAKHGYDAPASGGLGLLVTSIWSTAVTKVFNKIFGGGSSEPKLIYYTGAGIGGGYHADGGTITISDNASVSASAGALPPGFAEKEYTDMSAAIGEGKKNNGAGTTKVTIYQPASVTTAKLHLELGESVWSPKAGQMVQTFNPVMTDMQTGPEFWPKPDGRCHADEPVRSRRLHPQGLEYCSRWLGYCLRGWARSPIGWQSGTLCPVGAGARDCPLRQQRCRRLLGGLRHAASRGR